MHLLDLEQLDLFDESKRHNVSFITLLTNVGSQDGRGVAYLEFEG